AAVVASLSAYPAAPATILRKLTGREPPSNASGSNHIQAECDDLIDMFFAAGPAERRLILTNLDAAAETPLRQQAVVSSEVIRRLETAALQRNIGEFSRVLERVLGINQALAERIARDHLGEPIVVAAKAFGMQAAVFQRVLLFLNPVIGQSVERVHDLARLFDDLSIQAAGRMVAIWRKTESQSRPVHEPVHWDDERRGARLLSTPTRHRAIRDRDEQSSRFKTGGR
ncbi:MAG: hypothetical protein HY543_09545, partial [Deltaproteobacteria bacterium]|nr:hypothetical protein [Deltaproteobacteria bacterium]